MIADLTPDGHTVRARIEAVTSPLKLLVKTRNETVMLRDWVSHHARIVGPDNLIILDNMSDTPEALALLEELATDYLVVRFRGSHNHLHDRASFPGLYAAVTRSCAAYMAMDADERLVWLEDGRWIADQSIPDRVSALGAFSMLPGLLLDNFAGEEDRFDGARAHDGAEEMVTWGKPLISSGATIPGGHRLHNCQFPRALLQQTGQFHVASLHLCHLYPQERMRANREKLLSRAVISAEMSLDDIAALPLDSLPTDHVSHRCVTEIRDIMAIQAGLPGHHWGPRDVDSSLTLRPDGTLAFATDGGRSRFEAMLGDPAQQISQMKLPGTPSPADSTASELAAILARPAAEAEHALHQAMRTEPDRRDRYGDPVWRKELIRLMLAQGRFEDAGAMVPGPREPGRKNWYNILFARAHDLAGRPESALPHWQAFLDGHPGHPEALAALAKAASLTK